MSFNQQRLLFIANESVMLNVIKDGLSISTEKEIVAFLLILTQLIIGSNSKLFKLQCLKLIDALFLELCVFIQLNSHHDSSFMLKKFI